MRNFLQFTVGFVGLHSILLGIFMYFFTSRFYAFFFNQPPDNLFFARQSGIFLFLAGLFYLFPLTNLSVYRRIILLIIISKILAVIFLLTNASFTPSPPIIYLTAAGDGAMAIGLAIAYFSYRKDTLPICKK